MWQVSEFLLELEFYHMTLILQSMASEHISIKYNVLKYLIPCSSKEINLRGFFEFYFYLANKPQFV